MRNLFQRLRKYHLEWIPYICKAYQQLPYNQIITMCRRKFSMISLSREDADYIQKATVEQHKSNFWFKMRGGVITASNFKYACHANLSMPPKSLILKICYPNKKFTTPAIIYGINNEKKLYKFFKRISKNNILTLR